MTKMFEKRNVIGPLELNGLLHASTLSLLADQRKRKTWYIPDVPNTSDHLIPQPAALT